MIRFIGNYTVRIKEEPKDQKETFGLIKIILNLYSLRAYFLGRFA